MNTKPPPLLLAVICLFLISFNSFASNPSKPSGPAQPTELMQQNKALLFEENIGQLMDENHNPITEVRYYGHSNGVNLYCKPGMISFIFTKTENDEKISEATRTSEGQLALSPADGGRGWKGAGETEREQKISTSRMDFVLINSNPAATITASDQQEYYENFYTTCDANHGITNAHTYKAITYKNIYPNIDMVLKAAGNGMEYSFLVHPGGKVSDIKLKWNGTAKAKALESGSIKYCNTLGSMEESAPKSFVEGKEVGSSFVKKGNEYGFEVRNHDKNKDLLIDPSLVWGTYFGGSDDDEGNGVATDASGNVYITGFTKSSNGISISGAYQISKIGLENAFLAKFNSSGNLVWSTYYGNISEVGNGASTDKAGNIYITGYTSSRSGMATNGAYQTSLAGNSDAFVAKFTSSGGLSWSTYFGGPDQDVGNAISTDTSGNVYLAGNTFSSTGIATAGSYQSSFSGRTDAFLAKFNNKGNLDWATYFGGNLYTYDFGVSTDASGDAFISGTTSSSSGIASSGAFQTSYAGNTDAFLAKFSNSGTRLWSTYFGGTDGDFAQAIATDNFGNVFITGNTSSNAAIVTSGAYQTSFEGYQDAFLAKFSTTGTLSWSTYYGGSVADGGQGLITDSTGNVFMTGYTGDSSGFATSNAYQTTFGGGTYDAFLATFTSSGDRIWATYYGGTGEDVGTGVSIDPSGNLFVVGRTAGNNGISTTGAHQISYAGGVEDAFLAKFNVPATSGVNPLNNPISYDLSIHPNPFTDKTLINFKLPQTSHVKISVVDMKGNILFIPTDKALYSGPNEIEINASETGLSPGTYFVNIMINDQFISKKVIAVK